MKSCRDVEAGRMEVNCFELERQAPRPTKPKKTPGLSLGGGKVRKMKKLGFLSFWRIFVKWVWAAVKPKGFRVKSKLKLEKACDVGPAKGSELGSGSVHSLGLDHVSESDLPDSDLVFGFYPGSGTVSVYGFGFPPSRYVSGFVSPPLQDQISLVMGARVSPVKPLDEGLSGATGLVPMVVAMGSVSLAVEQNPDKAVRHSFPVKGMLQQGFLGSITASPSALASVGISEALAAPEMVSVGPTESEDGRLDLVLDPDPEKSVVRASPLDFCTFDTIIDTTSVELTDIQSRLIEHLRKELKVNDTTKVVLKHIEKSFLRVNKGVLDGVLSAKEGESILAFHFK